ncbi:hypothetical protein B0H13DRAFT_1919156 [Mycena leptocephala]|nr:hypothetical protein B0H13DRAFT_1919156 [Mycena leptocephala]
MLDGHGAHAAAISDMIRETSTYPAPTRTHSTLKHCKSDWRLWEGLHCGDDDKRWPNDRASRGHRNSSISPQIKELSLEWNSGCPEAKREFFLVSQSPGAIDEYENRRILVLDVAHEYRLHVNGSQLAFPAGPTINGLNMTSLGILTFRIRGQEKSKDGAQHAMHVSMLNGASVDLPVIADVLTHGGDSRTRSIAAYMICAVQHALHVGGVHRVIHEDAEKIGHVRGFDAKVDACHERFIKLRGPKEVEMEDEACLDIQSCCAQWTNNELKIPGCMRKDLVRLGDGTCVRSQQCKFLFAQLNFCSFIGT